MFYLQVGLPQKASAALSSNLTWTLASIALYDPGTLPFIIALKNNNFPDLPSPVLVVTSVSLFKPCPPLNPVYSLGHKKELIIQFINNRHFLRVVNS